jgi:hypothetical protein
MAVTSDVVGAYHRLYSDIPEIKRKVAAGGMAITVYSLVKRFDPEFKRYLAKKKGKVSATYVRRAKKNWEEIKSKVEDPEPEEVEEGTEVVQVAPMRDIEELPSYHLGKALSAVSHLRNKVDAGEFKFEMAEFVLLNELGTDVTGLMFSLGADYTDLTAPPETETEQPVIEEEEEVEEEGGEYVFS